MVYFPNNHQIGTKIATPSNCTKITDTQEASKPSCNEP